MSPVDLLRPSRDGDQFHYTWAARQALRLLDERSGLCALYVEAVDPSEHPAASSTDQHQRAGQPPADAPAVAASWDDDVNLETGDEVIDLAEYWGSTLWVPETSHTSRDLLILVEQAAESVAPLDACCRARRPLGGVVVGERPGRACGAAGDCCSAVTGQVFVA